MKVETILDQIDLWSIALPEFQRGFVWNRDQVRGLMASLYRRHPVGSLLVWVAEKDTATMRGGPKGGEGTVDLLLDGQQRITTLYGVVKGRPPQFFDGDPNAFRGLHFHLEDEVFEFYAPAKMAGNPLWIDVTKLMETGAGKAIVGLMASGLDAERVTEYANRLNLIDTIKDVDLHVEKVTGRDKTLDVVVDIFNQVNSGGTKLSKGDLALARVCAQWPAARNELKASLARWSAHGYHFELDWLLRNITTVTTGRARFSELEDVDTATFRQGLIDAEASANKLLNLVSARLGLDHDRVLGGRYAFPVMTRYLVKRGGSFQGAVEQDRLLYWYVNSFLWGRFTSSVETVLTKDLELIDGTSEAIDGLIDQLRMSRGDLKVRPDDFRGWSLGARFYPMLYLLTRTYGARDLGGLGQALSHYMLGKGSSLEVHHIFPKAVLYPLEYQRAEVNALANFCFLTGDTNRHISATPPEEYFPEVEGAHPGALASQWIPTDERLWRPANYRDFLQARRELLAAAANEVLDGLLHAPTQEQVELASELTMSAAAPVVADVLDPEIAALLDWIEAQGLAAPALDLDIVDPGTQVLVVNADLAWPNGVQPLLGEPVAFELEADESVLAGLSAAGYRPFATIEGLRRYLDGILHPEPVRQAREPEPLSAAAERFHLAMRDLYLRARDEVGYNAVYLRSMIGEVGGLETAHILLRQPTVSDGFLSLWERGRLDLAVESLVIQPEFADLFSAVEIDAAAHRLSEFQQVVRAPQAVTADAAWLPDAD